MDFSRSTRWCGLLASLGALCSLSATSTAIAGEIALNTYLQFSFSLPGIVAAGCQPDDPDGSFCIPSSGTPTFPLGAPSWTFTAPSTGATLRVTDAFTAGDQFEIFDFGASIGLTTAPIGDADCGDDPVPCFLDPNVSQGIFLLTAGVHSITLKPVLSPGEFGSGFLIVESAHTNIPEPPTLAILGLALAFIGLGRRSGCRFRTNPKD